MLFPVMTASVKRICKEEFQFQSFGFDHESPHLFVLAKCGPRLLYPIWTLIWFFYHLLWFILEPYFIYGVDGSSENTNYLLYFTNWGYMILGFSNLMDAISTVYVHYKRPVLISKEYKLKDDRLPWYLRFSWFLFETSNTIAITVTIGLYSIHIPTKDPPSIEFHAINTVYVVLNLFVSAKPVRVLHLIYPMIFAGIYILFTVVYQPVANNTAIYSELDWNEESQTIAALFVTVVIVVPLMHVSLYAFYVTKTIIHAKLCRKRKLKEVYNLDIGSDISDEPIESDNEESIGNETNRSTVSVDDGAVETNTEVNSEDHSNSALKSEIGGEKETLELNNTQQAGQEFDKVEEKKKFFVCDIDYEKVHPWTINWKIGVVAKR
ncbi:protein rolling stone-like [Mytilus californianus]|uniref:protein rolling stone-like n=1 Tax=Mytilus californianus TaxID=6549 RepID=UPI002245B31E|nr:protein rolling stone-like [Mytilus californianus]